MKKRLLFGSLKKRLLATTWQILVGYTIWEKKFFSFVRRLFRQNRRLHVLSVEGDDSSIFLVSSEAKVHIIYTEKPTDEEPKTCHLRTLSSALGSDEAAKDALIYSYKEATSGFSAKLTPEQVAEISKQLGVIQVVPSQTYQLHKPVGGGFKLT